MTTTDTLDEATTGERAPSRRGLWVSTGAFSVAVIAHIFGGYFLYPIAGLVAWWSFDRRKASV